MDYMFSVDMGDNVTELVYDYRPSEDTSRRRQEKPYDIQEQARRRRRVPFSILPTGTKYNFEMYNYDVFIGLILDEDLEAGAELTLSLQVWRRFPYLGYSAERYHFTLPMKVFSADVVPPRAIGGIPTAHDSNGGALTLQFDEPIGLTGASITSTERSL